MTDLLSVSPAEQLRARLDDPAVASALNTLLDHAELLAFGAVAAQGFLERGDTITSSIGAGLKDVKAMTASASAFAEPAKRFADDSPQIVAAIEALLASGMLNPQVVALLGQFAGAILEGTENARRTNASVTGVMPLLRAVKDPEVGRGIGVALEIVKSLGRTVNQQR